MKVNTALLNLDDGNATKKVEEKPDVAAAKNVKTEPDTAKNKTSPSKHSGIKTFFLVIIMIGGFILFAWNMINYVNNMRLDGQGRAISIVSEMDKANSIDNFMDQSNTDTSLTQSSTDNMESSTDNMEGSANLMSNSVEDNTGISLNGFEADTDIVQDDGADLPDDAASLKQIAIDAENETALVRQELKNAEDMLNASLQREAELKNQLEAFGKKQ